MDIVDRQTRSRMMSGIRSRNTRPELRVRRFLHSEGFRFRLHVASLPGKPDLVLKKHNLVVFVHGCFWHCHHGCRFATTPGTNAEWWMKKLSANVARDKRDRLALLESGWRVLVLWECGLKGTVAELDLAWLPAWIKDDEACREWPTGQADKRSSSPSGPKA